MRRETLGSKRLDYKISSALARDAFPLITSLICTLFVFEEVGVYAICGRGGRQ